METGAGPYDPTHERASRRDHYRNASATGRSGPVAEADRTEEEMRRFCD